MEALSKAHIPAVLAACGDWEELAQFGAPYWRPRSAAELKRKVAATAGPTMSTDYTFVLFAEERMVGEVSVHAIDWRNRVAQIGICIWAPPDRRQGLGSGGIRLAMSWAFGHLRLDRLEAGIIEGNEPSMRTFARLGFRLEGVLRKRYLHDGHKKDMHVFGLMAGEHIATATAG